jgi:two-component system, OmpR family, copper resistance phosphate regulon response regulator CusR
MKPHDLLVIEDNPNIATLLQHDLMDAGYTVRVADSVMQGLIQCREQLPDLLLLDLGLPDGHGRDVLTRLRASHDVPVIVLTALDAVEQKVELLELGADDYVVKPYLLPELLARIGVQLRQSTPNVLTVGGLEVFPDQRLAVYQDKELPLSPKEFELLAMMMRQPGRVYTRQEFNDQAWGGTLLEGSNVLDVHMANLRAKLRDAELYGLLRTVRGLGFALRG